MMRDETNAAAPQPFKIGDAVRQKTSGRLGTVEKVFTSTMPGLENACAVACRIGEGDLSPVYVYAASELERA